MSIYYDLGLVVGPQGPKGDSGSGFKVMGYYPSPEALSAALPSAGAGDAYGVGEAAPYDIYIWDEVNAAWVNNGPLQGAKGEAGADGKPGADGKSAYEAAQEGGYGGSETQFNSDLAQVSDKVDQPITRVITLTVGGWQENEQTVEVEGVSADEAAQLIIPTPNVGSQIAYYNAGIWVSAQAEGQLTFGCEEVPESSLTVYVVIVALH